jgi:hypothetical protein
LDETDEVSQCKKRTEKNEQKSDKNEGFVVDKLFNFAVGHQ